MKTRELKGTLPSKKAATLAARAAEIEESKGKEDSELRGAIGRLAATEDGKYFLRWLKKECGYGGSYVAIDAQGKPNPELTLYQAFRLNLWWKVRKYLPIRHLIEVEHE